MKLNTSCKRCASSPRLKKYSEAKIGTKRMDFTLLPKERAEDMYLNKRMTYKEIAESIGKSVCYVQNRIKHYGIPTRKGGSNRFVTVATRAKLSKALKGKKRTPEQRARYSAASRKGANHPNFGKKAAHPKRIWHQCPSGEWVSMRSNWEVAYAEYLTANGVVWEYEPKTFTLSDGSAYTPDFYIPSTAEYVEVKGWFREEHKKRVAKFRESYPEVKYILAEKSYLLGLGINLKQKFISTRPMFPCELCKTSFARIYKQQRFCSCTCRNRYICQKRYEKKD